MKLSEAEVMVTTQYQMDNNIHEGDWFQLSEYGDTSEFYNVCCSYFPDEKNPVFRYPAWENIPDILINIEWFCPNFFDIRDAIDQLEESEVEYFISWCGYHGHDIATDDPHLLVTNYLDNHTSYPEFESETADMTDDALIHQCLSSNSFDRERYSFDIFNDNYD